MSDDLKEMIKDLKKRVKESRSSVQPIGMDKLDVKKQKQELFDFLINYDLEIKKSDAKDLCVQNMLKDFQGMRLVDIRFVIEKSYDKYNKMLELVKKYEENFSEEELKKYEHKTEVYNEVFTFMVANHIGEYLNVEETD